MFAPPAPPPVQALSVLAEIKKVHIIASIDHLNAPLMWDHEKLSRYNWIWQDSTTFAPYATEISYDNSVTTRSSLISVAGTMAVMQSLTRNGRKVFWILLAHQMEHGDAPEYHGLRFIEYLAACQKQFAAHDDAR